MTTDEILAQTFIDHEHLAPDAGDVLRDIRTRLNRDRRRSVTRLAPVLMAALVVAIAVTVVVVRSGTGHSSRSADPNRPTPVADPEAVATAAARTILREVPLPPGARAIATEPAVLKRGPFSVLSSLQAEATGMWLAPGTVPATVAFASEHPAPGFTANCVGCGSPGTVRWVDFYYSDESREINYVIAPYASGVAIKITVIVPWVPTRPRWSYVADSATSVEVTVQRVGQRVGQAGAPTVHRTLNADATRRLAAVANSLRSEASDALCFGPLLRIAATDKLVFAEPGRTITFTMNPSNCPQFTVEATGQKPVYLETTPLDVALLHELGLPPDYGH